MKQEKDLPQVPSGQHGLDAIVKQLKQHGEATNRRDWGPHDSAMEEVEQKREVECQVQETRQVQKPHHLKPLCFLGLHPAVAHFAKTGILNGEEGVLSAATFLGGTCMGAKHKAAYTAFAGEPRLFVSAEFVRTVEMPWKSEQGDDNYLVSYGPVLLAG